MRFWGIFVIGLLGCALVQGCATNNRREEITAFVDRNEQFESRRVQENPEANPPPVSDPGGQERRRPDDLPVVILQPLAPASDQRASADTGAADGGLADKRLADRSTGLFLLRSEVKQAVTAGPGRLLGYVRVRPHSMKRRFLGFEILELRSSDARFQSPHLRPGDVILHINGIRMKNPENLYDALQTLRYAPDLKLDIWRDDKRVIVTYAIREDGAD